MSERVVVTGAGGFIGHHLVKRLKTEGFWVRGVDASRPPFEPSPADEFATVDLRVRESCRDVLADAKEVYHLAADMGGIGYISGNHATIATNNVLMDAHVLATAAELGVERLFYSSSACIYPLFLQGSADVAPLREEDAVPADPEEGYGWEKLYAEKMCEYYERERMVQTRVARFHNVYGPLGTFDGGREKAPAAICRKVALASDGDEIEVWGDGKQTRSFMYIDDCVEGITRIMRSDHADPLNLGTDELVTIDELIETVADIAEKAVRIRHDTTQPQGVRGRNSDNTRLKEVLDWQPSTPLREGLVTTYTWIQNQLKPQFAASAATRVT